MKRITLILFLVLTSAALFGQNYFRYPVRAYGGLIVGGNYNTGYYNVKIDSITSNGTDIKFYSNGAILEATPGAGAASWGSITGLLSSQTDLTTALGLKANANNAAFTGTTTGITAGMVGAMSTSHAANAITGTDITNWGTAYTNNLRWSGTATGLVASTGRTSLGGTDVGQAFFTLTNPGAITFPQINANNTVSALTASAFTTAIGAGHVASVTATFTAGALTDVALTGVTTKPYNIMIQTTAGKDITSAVSDSLGISGGTYHLYVYSIDLITDAEIKVTY